MVEARNDSEEEQQEYDTLDNYQIVTNLMEGQEYKLKTAIDSDDQREYMIRIFKAAEANIEGLREEVELGMSMNHPNI